MTNERNGRKRRIATYERVSSEDQRERETIKTQTEALARRLEHEPDVELVKRYVDDGISGTIPLAQRPAGARLMADAERRRFEELWVYKIDRLGRDDIDPLIVWRELERLGVRVYSTTEGVSSPFEYHIRVAMAAEERRTFLQRSQHGMERAVKEGRFPGGVVPYGYKLEGRKQTARLVVSEDTAWREWTESDVIHQIFQWSGVDGWSCRRIAEHLNALGVPTHYQKDARCVRKKATRAEWTPGRINQILTNTTYKGIYQYGKRSKKRDVIKVPLPAVVSEALWDAAQATRNSHRLNPKNLKTTYPLRSLIKCHVCGLNYSGTPGRDPEGWYRCNGQIAWRGKLRGACYAKSLKGNELNRIVFADIYRWLDNPGDLLEELATELQSDGAAAQREVERQIVQNALRDIPEQRSRVLELYRRKRLDESELDGQMDAIAEEHAELERRLIELQPIEHEHAGPDAHGLLAELHKRRNKGFIPDQMQQLASILVKRILIKTERLNERDKRATVEIEYRFPCVVDDCTDRDS